MKKSTKRRLLRQACSSRGFALVETIIALVILSIAILAIAIVPIMSSKMAIQTTQRERAMTLAYNGLDFLESVGPSISVVSPDVKSGDFFITYIKRAYDVSSGDYSATVSVKWEGVAGESELVLERRLSRDSNRTRGE